MTHRERKWECIQTNKDYIINNNWKPENYRYCLKPGSIIIMGGSFQEHWYHKIPKNKNKDYDEIRYNLTFRPYISLNN